jgi:1-deoxy-D-xylulose-5-phosphate reductoisomerase
MMNKGLELIEACWLFNVRPDQVEVVIHPQSVIHSLVSYVDGSVLAQLGNPDMRTPIAHALAWPQRIDSGVAPLNLVDVARLDFEAPDLTRFPCLALAIDAAASGRDYPVALNAANEVAVDAFLGERIGFTAISRVVDTVLQHWQPAEPVSLDQVQDADHRARVVAKNLVESL